MRVFLALLILLLPTASTADVASCQRLYLNAPKSLLGRKLSEGVDMEKRYRGSGYILKYGSGSKSGLTLIFFDMRKRRIPEKMAVEALIGHAQLKLAQRRAAGLAKHGNLTFTDKNLPVRGAAAAAIMHAGATERALGNQYLMTGVIDNCMYKLLFDTPGSNKKADTLFHKLLNELSLHLGTKG